MLADGAPRRESASSIRRRGKASPDAPARSRPTRRSPRIRRVAEVSGEQDEHRAEALAARRDQVRRRLGEQAGRFHAHGLLQRLLHLVQARADIGLEGRVRRLESRDHPSAHRITT
jgi:hypothetical protein